MKIQYLGFIPAILLTLHFIRRMKRDNDFNHLVKFLLGVTVEAVGKCLIIIIVIFGLLWALS